MVGGYETREDRTKILEKIAKKKGVTLEDLRSSHVETMSPERLKQVRKESTEARKRRDRGEI